MRWRRLVLLFTRRHPGLSFVRERLSSSVSRSRSFNLVVSVVVAICIAGDVVCAADSLDGYVSMYVLTAFPADPRTVLLGTVEPGATLRSGIGGGIKAALFPNFTWRVLGVELESFTHGGAVHVPSAASTGGGHGGRSDLLIATNMVNVIARVPSGPIRPYGGVGIGYAQAILLNPSFATRADKDFEGTLNPAYQWLAGAQVQVSARIFVFGEYRRLIATYRWPGLAVDYHADTVAMGLGVRF